MRLRNPTIVALCALTSLAMDCGPEWMEPTYELVAGDYTAFAFEVIEEGVVRDLLEEGFQVELSLLPDGTTTGRYRVPGGPPDGIDYEADLAGTWHIGVEDEITLDHAADTFLRDMIFYWTEGGELYGDADVPGDGLVWVTLVPVTSR